MKETTLRGIVDKRLNGDKGGNDEKENVDKRPDGKKCSSCQGDSS